MMRRSLLIVATAVMLAAGCSRQTSSVAPTGPTRFGEVDEARLIAADRDPDQWLTPGRDAGGSYYSPLEAINDTSVSGLGFAWEYSVGTKRGLEATPVVVDGVMYTSGNWGRVYALDAATGRQLWTYDPAVDGQTGRYACCDVVNRGVAVRGGRVFVASLDGYLHAIDARTGQRIWRADTLPARGAGAFHYFSTGAPVIAGNVVAIGNGGGDFAGARGSVAAFDLATGDFRWRFYTVPRDPKLGPQDQPHLEAAIKTWDPHYRWEFGAGGSVWDGLSYDPELKLVYFGTGNTSPYDVVDTTKAGHDELYAASIVAVHADTGALAWHYQEIPGEGWDYDTTAKLVLTELPIEGKLRRVLLQASKNGFLYVLDRATGEFLSAAPYATVNWTRGIDPKTHRPIPSPDADWTRSPKLLAPGATGAHNWQPMAFSRKTGLVYIPVIDMPMVYVNTQALRAGLIEGNFELAFFATEDYDPAALAALFGKLPALEGLAPAAPGPLHSRGVLRAVDPVTGKTAWEQQTATPWDGGVMATAGNLVFRGDAAGALNVYAADSGKLLKSIDVGTSIMAAPMTYRVNGEQYVAVMAGYGGGVLYAPFPPATAAYRYGNAGRIVAFKLGGGAVPKPAVVRDAPFAEPPPRAVTAEQVATGEVLYSRYCARCHAMGRGLLPDLRRLTPETHRIFSEIVLRGAYSGKGMARWDDVLSQAQADALHGYLIDQAWQAYDAERKAAH
jgi:quinohemoprotein ethanol dehydrogenase